MYQIIKSRFEKAVNHYDENAIAQKEIADKLFSLIPDKHQLYDKIFEFGCGTGNLSILLKQLKHKELILNDITPNYKSVLDKKLIDQSYQFICDYAEKYLNRIENNERFNLIISSSAIQWIPNLEEFIISCYKTLENDGILAFSSFTNNNLTEVKKLTNRGLHYPNIEETINNLNKKGLINLKTLSVYNSSIILMFDSAQDILKHLKLTGVTGTSDKTWTKGDLYNFINGYEKFKDNNQYPLTYSPSYIICRKIN